MWRVAVAWMLVWHLAGCAAGARQRPAWPPLADEGEVHLFLEPLPREAGHLDFAVQSVAALREDGGVVPLDLALRAVSGAGARDQRLLASGRLPPGRYQGFLLGVGKASIEREGGRADLLVDAEPARIDRPFQVSARNATVFWLDLRFAGSIEKGFAFRPSFGVSIPERTQPTLAGYCASTGRASLTVFDRRARRVTGVLPTGRAPRGLVLDAASARLYVALSGEDQIAVVDAVAREEVTRIRLRGGDQPRDLALSPDGRTLIVLSPGSRTASFVDPGAGLEVGRVAVGDEPWSLAMDRQGRRAYVVNRRSNSVTVLDVANRAAVGTLATDPQPLRAALNRAGDRLYLIHAGSPYLGVFSLPSLAPVNRVFVGLGASALEVDARTDLVYVGWSIEGAVSVYDPFSLMPVDDFRVPDPVSYAAIDDAENTILFLMPERRAIAVVDLTSRRILGVLDVGVDPFDLTVSGERR